MTEPPADVLIRVTTRDGEANLATFDHPGEPDARFWLLDGAWLPRGDVRSWEPLLVVPDTEAVAELVASVIGQQMMIRKGPPEIAAAVLAALREVP